MRSPPSGVGSIVSSFEPVDVDEVGRRLDLELHQIEQVRAARDELGAGPPRNGRCGLGRRARALIGEGLHPCLPATSVIASTMLE